MTAPVTLKAEDTLMFTEAGSAAGVVARQLAENEPVLRDLGEKLRNLKPRAVVTCARGSSDHAATYAKYVIETKAGLLVSSAAPSVCSVYDARQMLEGTLFIAISQSGASPDLVRTATAAKDAGAPISIAGFVRFQLGEGIEKEEADFAAEVAATAGA